MTDVVIDANVALALVVPLAYSDRVLQFFDDWKERGIQFTVPALWGYEVVSGLRKAVAAGILLREEAESGLQYLWALEPHMIEATLDRHLRAFVWAERIGQTVAYDAQYLVIAEELQVPFWTADQLLVKNSMAAGADWVRWIGTSE
jgi:predicted nucleic acid-binding protein